VSALLEEPRLEARSVRRLLAGHPSGSLRAHLEVHGPLPSFRKRRGTLIDAIEASGLTGRGGAGFPTALKLRAVARGRRPVVVANGTEGEPASGKDAALIAHDPHLVLDGALLAAEALHAGETIVAVARGTAAHARLAAAIAERRDARDVRLVALPDRFVAGEESALVHWLNGGDARPTFTPPRVFEQGVGGRPTLVQNVETLAHVALIARHGPDWFRELGTDAEPGSALATVGGCVRHPGVVELALGEPIRGVLDACGGLTAMPQALLVGGYFGTWIPARGNLDLPLANAGLRPLGATLGARTIVAFPEESCGIVETARVARYLAAESAGQCGPCVFGLRAVADATVSLAARDARAPESLGRLLSLFGRIEGRGACAHPDGAVRFVESALRVFDREADLHARGRCTASAYRQVLPAHPATNDWR
jgi:NADH:ubiquinone oxidoreductase subunit F (NADH-binding)